MRNLRWAPFLVIALAVAACGTPANAGGGADATPETSVEKAIPTTMAETKAEPGKKGESGFTCPITISPQPAFEASEPKTAVYTENFPQPESYPTEYPGKDGVWYGDDGLWTVLPLDGLYDERKTVFWSNNFPGGTVEERPELHVTWTRLDSKEERVVDNDGVATNAYTPAHGWFMITGTEVLDTGCWQVDATYKGSTLTYVYEKAR